MKVYYEETYGNYYEIDNETKEEKAKDKLIEAIREGKEDGPDQCVGSITIPIIGKGDPQFQIMGGKIDAMPDEEKTFYLWHLLRYYYKRELRKDKEKYANDKTTVEQIDRLLANVEELDTLLCYDLF